MQNMRVNDVAEARSLEEITAWCRLLFQSFMSCSDDTYDTSQVPFVFLRFEISGYADTTCATPILSHKR